MNNHGRLGLCALLIAVALMLASCAGGGSAQQGNSGSGGETQGEQGSTSDMQGMEMGSSGSTAPAELVQNGNYSDERFIDMMVPHHQMAIDMARVAEDKGEHDEIRELVDNITSTQQQEIDELKSIKEQKFGSSDVPTQMEQSEMDNMGMMTPDELANQQPFDRAFVDSMLPHHASAIEMASVANMHSDDPDIKRIARNIIDAHRTRSGR